MSVVSMTGAQPGGHVEVLTPFGSGSLTYTVSDSDMGKIITTRSATGAPIVKLPAPANHKGARVEVLNIVNQACRIDSNAAGQLVALNDLTASSVTMGAVANKRVGASAVCFCDGTSWFVNVNNVTATAVTVA